MISISLLTFNPFQENTYVVSDETGECIIIDAGNYSASDDRKLAQFIADKKLTPKMAINTHGHIDHVLGIKFATETYNIPFALHSEDNFWVENIADHAKNYGFEVEEVPSSTIDLKGMDEISFGNTTLKIIHTPGHSPGHVVIYHPESKTLFSGDTLFRESIGRTDLPGGDYEQIMSSILDNIVPLGDDVNIFPGHGPKSSIGHEVLYNPFVTEVIQGQVKHK